MRVPTALNFGGTMFEADKWQHKNCGGQPREFEPGKWECTKCNGAWYAGVDFFKYLANVVFVAL
jgi:hypothetical protein